MSVDSRIGKMKYFMHCAESGAAALPPVELTKQDEGKAASQGVYQASFVIVN